MLNLAPAPAESGGNQAPRAAPSARAIAHARTHYESNRELEGFGDPRAFPCAAPQRRPKFSEIRRERLARVLWYASALAAVPAQGETLAFFRLSSLRRRPWGGGNARIFSLVFLFAGVRGAGETLAFFRLFSVRWRPRGGGNARIFGWAACKKFRSALRAEVCEFALQNSKKFSLALRARMCFGMGFARGARARGAQRSLAAARRSPNPCSPEAPCGSVWGMCAGSARGKKLEQQLHKRACTSGRARWQCGARWGTRARVGRGARPATPVSSKALPLYAYIPAFRRRGLP